jgi:hypothetical protein
MRWLQYLKRVDFGDRKVCSRITNRPTASSTMAQLWRGLSGDMERQTKCVFGKRFIAPRTQSAIGICRRSRAAVRALDGVYVLFAIQGAGRSNPLGLHDSDRGISSVSTLARHHPHLTFGPRSRTE